MEFMYLDDIIRHIDSKFAGLIYVGRDYTLADLVRDLEYIAEMHASDLENASLTYDV